MADEIERNDGPFVRERLDDACHALDRPRESVQHEGRRARTVASRDSHAQAHTLDDDERIASRTDRADRFERTHRIAAWAEATRLRNCSMLSSRSSGTWISDTPSKAGASFSALR